MNTVMEQLKRRIRQKGAINVAEYMSTCLYDPDAGYYMTKNPLGASGDFTTAPEISQVFGEMIGIWLIDMWQKLGMPDPFHLVEVGPGRGTMMADILRTLKKVRASCYTAAQVTLVEISPHLKNLQTETLKGHTVTWVNNLEESSFKHPVLLIGNEVLDAFPVRQFMKKDDGYFERLVTLEDDALVYKTGSRSYSFKNDAAFIETYDAMEKFLRSVKRSIDRGAALFIDYGAEGGGKDTLQALQNHRFVDVLERPGEADITTHVNFEAVKNTLGNITYGPTDMSYFLTQMGLPIRAATLLESAETDAERASIEQGVYRLIHPNEMGALFKVLCWSTAGVPAPAGFMNTYFQ